VRPLGGDDRDVEKALFDRQSYSVTAGEQEQTDSNIVIAIEVIQ
jgi:hypothetical protein